VWTGSELIICGGNTNEFIPGGLSNGGARWNRATGLWTPRHAGATAMRTALLAIACLATTLAGPLASANLGLVPRAAAEPSAEELAERRAALEARLGPEGFTVVVCR
jgi:hypothetical protein